MVKELIPDKLTTFESLCIYNVGGPGVGSNLSIQLGFVKAQVLKVIAIHLVSAIRAPVVIHVEADNKRVSCPRGAEKVIIHVPVNKSLSVHTLIYCSKIKKVLPNRNGSHIAGRG